MKAGFLDRFCYLVAVKSKLIEVFRLFLKVRKVVKIKFCFKFSNGRHVREGKKEITLRLDDPCHFAKDSIEAVVGMFDYTH